MTALIDKYILLHTSINWRQQVQDSHLRGMIFSYLNDVLSSFSFTKSINYGLNS